MGEQNRFDRAVVWLSAPVQWLVVGALDGVTRAWSRYVHLVGVERENESLRRESAELRAALAHLREQQLENERLHRVLALGERAPRAQRIVATVIGVAPTPLFRSVRIDKGTRHGVRTGAAVCTHAGLAGRVATVTEAYADVMLLVDANSSIDVLVQRTRDRARVRGAGRDKALALELQHLERTADVLPGDVLIASGAGGVIPKGLSVGTVISVERPAFGLYQQASVSPAVDFGRLEEVMVILSADDQADFEPVGPGEPAAEASVIPNVANP